MKTQLLNEERFIFTNEEEGHEAECFARKFFGTEKQFAIIFNCELIHTSKTFKSFEKKLNQLKEKWNLELSEEIK